MSKRKLASIRQIKEIKPHTNADSLELAIVDGWQCVVKKGEFKAGDKVVYFEVDSVLPVCQKFEFLRKCCYVQKDWLPNGEGFRLKTIRLRGELSQGLVVPLGNHFGGPDAGNPIGEDVTDLLKVVKWDPPVPAHLQGQVKGPFPSFIPKTDQERAQNLVEEIREIVEADWDEFEVTIKLDGTSCTMYHYNGVSGVCSRNLEMKVNEENKDNTYVKLFVESGMLDMLEYHGRNIAIQGEVMGPGIQGNREGLKVPTFFVFDIFDIDEQRYLTPGERAQFEFDGQKNVYHIPCEWYGVRLPGFVDKLLEVADGPSLNNPVREGLVWKRMDGKFSFKTISNKFLESEK